MADKRVADSTDEEPKKKKKLPKTMIIVLAVTAIEAVVFFAVFKMVGGGPEAAHGEDSHVIEGAAASQPVGTTEIELVKSFKVPNDKSGRMFIYDMDVSIVVAADDAKLAQEFVDTRTADIADRLARIVRSAHHQMLWEDDLRALRQQLRAGLAEIANDDDLVRRILIPRFVPMRSD